MNSDINAIKDDIVSGKTTIGIEVGSTRIKSILIDENYEPIAYGSHEWENKNINHIWTYDLDDIWKGVQDSYRKLAQNVQEQYGVALTNVGAIGFSAMMHGYMAFDRNDELLTPFRTWRNTITAEASAKLSELFHYPIPQRWSIAHLYQAILKQEEHIADIDFITTLAGYIHWQLTGNKILGVGDASGMFPIDPTTKDFNQAMIDQFDETIAQLNLPWKLRDILPKVLTAGESGGSLTKDGALLLDPTGKLQAGIPLCPPEGDAGTGMVGTNSVAPRTGNVSTGTSVFAMIVLENDLSNVYSEIDMVTTPEGRPVAMVHANNCTTDYDAWLNLFSEAVSALGFTVDKDQLYGTLLGMALEGDADCGGLLSYGYISGEHITGFEEGRPMFVRSATDKFNLANFMRVHLYSALGALRIGMNILLDKESVKLDEILGHGGFFKTKNVGQRIMASALNVPVSLMDTAAEGGAWGIAVIAAYMIQKEKDESLESFLKQKVFYGKEVNTYIPNLKEAAGFDRFMERYEKGLTVQRAAVDYLK